MADNNIQIDLELTTKAFEAAIGQATRAVEGFSGNVAKATTGANEALDKVGKAGKDAGEHISHGAEKSSEAWEVFKGVLEANAVEHAFELIKEAAEKLFEILIVEGVKAAQEHEDAEVHLAASIRETGAAGREAVEGFNKFAEELQKTSTVSAKTALENLALAKSYGITNEQAKQVVQVATDMSAALGIDLHTAVTQVSATFNGAVGRLAKLNPALKDLTEAQKEAGAAADILGAQFAGQGKARLETYSGSVQAAKNSLEGLQEHIGDLIIKNPALLAAIQSSVGVFERLGEYVVENSDQIKEFITTGIDLLVNAFASAVSGGEAFIDFLRNNADLIETLAVGFGTAAAAYGVYTTALGVTALAQAALNLVLSANPIGIVIVALGSLAAATYYVATHFDELAVSATGFAATCVGSVISGIKTLISGLGLILPIIQPIISAFGTDITDALDSMTATIQEKQDELLQLQAQGQLALDQKRDAALLADKLKRDGGHADKLAGNKATDTAEADAEKDRAADALATLTKRLQAEAKRKRDAATAAEAAEKARIAALQAQETGRINFLKAQRKEETKYLTTKDEEANQAEIARDDELFRKKIQSEKSFTDSLIASKRDQIQFAEATDKQRVEGVKNTLGAIAGLMDSSNGALFEAGKAAAIAQSTISTYEAVVNALAQVPYPFNIAAAAAVGVAGALQITKIASTPRPAKTAGNFAEGGIVPGASFSGDRLTARVNSGEGIFTTEQQKRLFDIANGKQGTGEGSGKLQERIDALTTAIASQPVVVQLDGHVIATAVRTQVRGGFSLGT
jgi:hypothetical protein